MSASRAARRAVTLVVTASVVAAVAPLSLTSARASTDRLRMTFDADGAPGTVLAAGAPISDVSGQANHGHVVTAYGGTVVTVTDPTGLGADFPGKCGNEPCPNAIVDVPDSPTLDPLLADFEWGARILLKSTETANGENIVQKGRYGEAGGQWKLQVDHSAGVPSCVVSGKVPGSTTERQVVVLASRGVADGVWHQLTCRRSAAAGVQILIDGIVRGSAAMPVVLLDSPADVTIGAKDVLGSDNDQFLGVLDDVFMTVLDGSPPPNSPPTARFTASCTGLTCAFDGSGSTDDGPLTYAWDFGDGATDTVVKPSHNFAAGDHTVTLTVTDAAGLVSTITQSVTVTDGPNTAPTAAFTSACVDLDCTFDASTSTDNGPVTYAWDFGDAGVASGVAPTHRFAGAGGHTVTLTVTDGPGLTGTITHTVTVSVPVAAITFVAKTSVSATTAAQVANVPAAVRAGDGLLMFLSVATNAAVSQPTGVTGWVQVDSLTNVNGSTTVWRKVATAANAGAQVRIGIAVASKANITIVAYRGTSATNPIAGFARTLITTSSANRTTPTTNVAASSVVVSYWMHRDSTTTALTPPAGVTVRASGTQSGGGHVTVLTADSGAAVPAGSYGGLTAKAAAASGLGTTWTIVLARA